MNDAIDYAREYDNSGRVENAAELIENYSLDAAFYRESREGHTSLDRPYGRRERNRIDIFWPDKGRDAPLVIFIHGGYWQRLDRKDFSHMAQGLNARGIAVALPSYTLCPQNTVPGIINEMRRACILLHETYKRTMTCIGHSAGGHLAACMMATDWGTIHPDLPDDLIAAGMGISGLYDLPPLTKTPVNDALRMDEETARAASPVTWVPDGTHRFEAWVGGEESDEYHRQSRDLARRWSLLGTPTKCEIVQGANHFTIVDQLTEADSEMVDAVIDLIDHPQVDAPPAPTEETASEENEEQSDEADLDEASEPEHVESS